MPLCGTCESLDLDEKESRLGEYHELLTRADEGCDSCRFFCNVLRSSNNWKERSNELSGRIIFLSSRRLDVRKPDRLNRRTYSVDELLFDYCIFKEFADPDDPNTDSKGPIPENSSDEACFDQIRSWLAECSSHDKCSKLTGQTLPRRVIEIPKNPQQPPKLLLSHGKVGRYAVLSHCSDDAELPNFDLDNGVEFKVETFPKTLQDALVIARRLDIPYLWIRDLCMSSDDVDEKLEGSSNLGDIYGNSTLMISARNGGNLDSGLFQDREVYHSPALGVKKVQFLRQRMLRWTEAIDYSFSGQAAQERMLAPRIVHYTSRQIVWECATGYKFEASNIPDKEVGSGQIRQQYRKEVVQPVIAKSLAERYESQNDVSKDGSEVARHYRRLEAWHTCVDHYSRANLSKPEDKLPGLAVLAELIEDSILGEYLAGIWSKNIGLGLAWSRVYPILTPSPTYRAPSFSWASVDGQISSAILYLPETLMQDQASDSTWIEIYGPKLLEHHTVLCDPLKPYGTVQEGSNVVLEASASGLFKLTTAISNDPSAVFQHTIVLDQSSIFDCSCCGPQNPSDEEKEASVDDLEHHICMIAQGDGWKGKDSVCVMLVLRATNEEGSFVRVGSLLLSLDYHYEPVWENTDKSFNAEPVYKAFEELGWERRRIKLL